MKELKFTAQGIADGFRSIASSLDIARENNHNAEDTATLAALRLMAYDPNVRDNATGGIDMYIDYENVGEVRHAVRYILEHWSAFEVLGGIVSAIKTGQLSEFVQFIKEHEKQTQS